MREWDLAPGPRRLRLRVCEWGDPGGPPIVILHGFLEQGASWSLVAPHLPGRVLAPDMRGHGLSGHVGEGGFYHFWDYVPDVVALIEAVGGPVDLVGHSMGGGVATFVAALRPDLVRNYVNIEGLGPPDAEGKDVDQARKYVAAMAEVPRHTLIADVDDGVRRMRRYNTDLPVELARTLVARTTRPVRDDDRAEGDGALIWTWDPLHRARAPYPFRASMFREFLGMVQAPTLFIRGGRSWFVLPDQAEREACIADLRTAAVADAGHMIHHQRPAELAALIAEHFA